MHPGHEHSEPSHKGSVGPVPGDPFANDLRGSEPDDVLDRIGPSPQVPDLTADERIASSRQSGTPCDAPQEGQDPARTALEAEAIEGYRSGALTSYQTRRLLGFQTRYELDGFLKAHNVWDRAYSLEDLEQDRRTMQQLEAKG